MDEKTEVRSQSPLRPLHWTRSVRLRVYFSSDPVRIPSNANILRLALVNRVPLGPITLRAIKDNDARCLRPSNECRRLLTTSAPFRKKNNVPSKCAIPTLCSQPIFSEEPLRLTFATNSYLFLNWQGQAIPAFAPWMVMKAVTTAR